MAPQSNNIRPQLQFPRGPIQIQQRQNLPPQRFLTNQQVFGKPSSNVWKPGQNRNFQQYKPTPMSTTSRNQFSNQQRYNFKPNYGQPQSSSKTTPEELFNVEPDVSYEENTNQDIYQDEPNYEFNEYVDQNDYLEPHEYDNNPQNFQLNTNLDIDP